MKMMREVGNQGQASYDKAEFRLTFSEDGEETTTIHLRNLYIEYCGKSAGERAAFLRRTCIGFARQFEVPEDFENAKHDLLPMVRSKSMSEVTRLDVEIRGGGSKWAELAAIPLSDYLETCLVYDLPTTFYFVTEEMLQKWGVSPYEAAEVARENLEQKEFMVGKVGDHLHVFVSGDAFDATRMLLLEPIRSLDLNGLPVALPLNRDSLMVTGADDVEGLELLATLAEKKKDEARPICPIPHKLVGDEWMAWLPPPDHPHHEKFKRLETEHLFGEYAEQKALLDKRHEQTGKEVFVATFSPAERDGEVMSYCVWSKDVPTWLPKTEFVGLYDPVTEHADFVTWERLEAVAGHLMAPLDCYPPRWMVDGFPSKDEIEKMSPENWDER
jgi:uncharacterized protein YtpQ (UPF0354 family)